MHQAVKTEFTQKLVAATRELNLGDPMDIATQMGALISEDHMNKVRFGFSPRGLLRGLCFFL